MRSLLLVATLLLAWASLPGKVHAFSWRHLGADCAPCVCYVEQKVTVYKPVWKEEKVTTEVTKVTWKKETVPVQITQIVQKEKLEDRTVIHHRSVPKIEEREITGYILVPECIIDPATCCPRMVTRPALVKHKVKVAVLHDVAEPKKESVKVLYCEPVTKTVDVERLVPEYKKEKVTETVKTCTLEPYTTTIKLPVGGLGCPPGGPGYFGPQSFHQQPGVFGQPGAFGQQGPVGQQGPFGHLKGTGPNGTSPFSSPMTGSGGNLRPMPLFPFAADPSWNQFGATPTAPPTLPTTTEPPRMPSVTPEVFSPALQ